MGDVERSTLRVEMLQQRSVPDLGCAIHVLHTISVSFIHVAGCDGRGEGGLTKPTYQQGGESRVQQIHKAKGRHGRTQTMSGQDDGIAWITLGGGTQQFEDSLPDNRPGAEEALVAVTAVAETGRDLLLLEVELPVRPARRASERHHDDPPGMVGRHEAGRARVARASSNLLA